MDLTEARAATAQPVTAVTAVEMRQPALRQTHREGGAVVALPVETAVQEDEAS